MKNQLFALTMIVVAFTSCKKKENDNVTPSNSEIAKMSAYVDGNDSLRITINYTDKNTGKYLDDLLKLYFNDTFTAVFTVDPQKPNTTYKFTPKIKYTASKYKVDLIREPSPGEKLNLASVTGTK